MKKIVSGSALMAVAAVIILAALAVWAYAPPQPKVPGPPPPPPGGQLHVSNTGSDINTNVSGDTLQQATPPEHSASSSDLSPQQAQPNYCAADEIPYQDACVPR
jgi:hypothetical protein